MTAARRPMNSPRSISLLRWVFPSRGQTGGAAGVANGMSSDARDYFAAGGMGILIGDGRLPHYGGENILEAYYSAAIRDWLTVGADYQFIAHPAYNRDRGPVSVLAARFHAEF